MMRKFFVILLTLMLVGCASNTKETKYHRSMGVGFTEDQALQNAFIKAIEYEVGVLILAEKESKNLELIKNDIMAYSSGYVEDYKIVSSKKLNDTYFITVDVLVSNSKIKNRILGRSNTDNKFEGNKHSNQYKSYFGQRVSSDKLLDLVFNDFPNKAFIINQKQYSIVYDNQRQAIVKIPFDFRWNHNYLEAVNEMLENIEDVSNIYTAHQGYVITILKKPNEMFGTQRRYRFNDMVSIRRLNVHLHNKEPIIKITAFDKNRTVIHKSCMNPKFFLNDRVGHELYRINNNHTTLFGNIDINNGTIILTFSYDLIDVLKKIYNIELTVVSPNNC